MLKVQKQKLPIPGAYSFLPESMKDNRGQTIKIASQLFQDFPMNIVDILLNESNKDVIRGMHYYAHALLGKKLIYCMQGQVVDVIMDLRHGHHQYQIYSIILNQWEGVFVPPGCAHGFLSLTSSLILDIIDFSLDSYAKIIHPLTIPFKWDISNPILSQQDQNAIDFDQFKIQNFFNA